MQLVQAIKTASLKQIDTQKKARRIRRQADFSRLDGWLQAHAVRVRTGEIDVSQCRQQEIATRYCRGRFIKHHLAEGTGYCRHIA